MRFIVDSNVGRLATWLRIAGFDTLFAKSIDDNRLVRIALDEDRVLLTKDRQILKRRLVTSGRLKVILIEDDEVKAQLRQVLTTLNLAGQLRPFSLCVECNEPLVPREREEVEELVPPYVFQTQTQYMRCPGCLRIYWRGTHWERMSRELEVIVGTV
ncbi:MAG: Mut7-C RNAse domain-containing protein [Dehalococcoidia bacterium]